MSFLCRASTAALAASGCLKFTRANRLPSSVFLQGWVWLPDLQLDFMSCCWFQHSTHLKDINQWDSFGLCRILVGLQSLSKQSWGSKSCTLLFTVCPKPLGTFCLPVLNVIGCCILRVAVSWGCCILRLLFLAFRRFQANNYKQY